MSMVGLSASVSTPKYLLTRGIVYCCAGRKRRDEASRQSMSGIGGRFCCTGPWASLETGAADAEWKMIRSKVARGHAPSLGRVEAGGAVAVAR